MHVNCVHAHLGKQKGSETLAYRKSRNRFRTLKLGRHCRLYQALARYQSTRQMYMYELGRVRKTSITYTNRYLEERCTVVAVVRETCWGLARVSCGCLVAIVTESCYSWDKNQVGRKWSGMSCELSGTCRRPGVVLTP